MLKGNDIELAAADCIQKYPKSAAVGMPALSSRGLPSFSKFQLYRRLSKITGIFKTPVRSGTSLTISPPLSRPLPCLAYLPLRSSLVLLAHVAPFLHIFCSLSLAFLHGLRRIILAFTALLRLDILQEICKAFRLPALSVSGSK